jgi:carbamoyl-phosphate synthase large subunit
MEPDKRRILVTAVGGDLGQSVIECLRDCGRDMYIVGCDMNPYAGGRKKCDDFFKAPPVKKEREYTAFILEIIKKENLDYVFPLSDAEIEFISNHKAQFEGCRAVFVMNEPHIVKVFMDKYATVEFFDSRGIACPETYKAEDYNGQLGFPVIVKKQRGSGSQGFFKVSDEEELQFYLKRHPGSIIQQYLPGSENEYTACIFSDGKEHYTITFRRKLAPGGFSGYVELVSDSRIERFLEQIAKALSFKGSINVQFRIVEGQCIPFEVNPRFSSTVYFRHRFGFQDIRWSMDMLEGKAISYRPLHQRGIGVKTFDHVFFDMDHEEL